MTFQMAYCVNLMFFKTIIEEQKEGDYVNDSVIDLSELLTLGNKNNVRVFEADAKFDNFFGRGIHLKSIEDFFELTLLYDVKAIYYFNFYADETEYLIPHSSGSSLPDGILNMINENISTYNKSLLDKIDFLQPVGQLIYFISEGYIHFISLDNPIFNDVPEVEEKYDEIRDDVIRQFEEEDIKEFQRKQKENLIEKVEYIQNEIINNEQFHVSTNSELRLKFGRIFFEENPDYHRIIKQAGYPKVKTFLDETWKLYRNGKSK